MSREYEASKPGLQNIVVGNAVVVVHGTGMGWALPGGGFTFRRGKAEQTAQEMDILLSKKPVLV